MTLVHWFSFFRDFGVDEAYFENDEASNRPYSPLKRSLLLAKVKAQIEKKEGDAQHNTNHRSNLDDQTETRGMTHNFDTQNQVSQSKNNNSKNNDDDQHKKGQWGQSVKDEGHTLHLRQVYNNQATAREVAAMNHARASENEAMNQGAEKEAAGMNSGVVREVAAMNYARASENEAMSQGVVKKKRPATFDTMDSFAHVKTLSELKKVVEAFEGCELKRTAKSTVFSDGNPLSRVMLVGEAPGAEEDLQGKPFVGRSGQLLDKMLLAIGLDRRSVYIANIVPWRPPGNRVPTPLEVALCLPMIEKHISLIKPKALMFLGSTAAKSLLKTNEGITRLRGVPKNYTNSYLERPIWSMATFHPAYLLRSPLQKRLVWEDLKALKRVLEEKGEV